MFKKIILTLLIFSLISSVCYAETLYVRPAGGSYGNEDGSTYADAWDGLLNVVWGTDPGEVGPSDTLYVAGNHLLSAASWPGEGGGDINMVSGSDDDNRVTVRGDYGGDAGTIWGAVHFASGYTTWNSEGSGTWSGNITDDTSRWGFIDVVDGTNYTVLDKEESVVDCKANAGSYYWDDDAKKLYVHAPDGLTPENRVTFGKYGYDFGQLDGLSYITFLNITFLSIGRSFAMGVQKNRDADYITWNGNTFIFGDHSFIAPWSGNDGLQVINSEMSRASNAIYTISAPDDVNPGASDYIFSGNYIYDIGNEPRTYHVDAHGIGIQGGDNGLIENNLLIDCGSSVALNTEPNQELTNTIFRYNVIKNSHSLGGANGYGIVFVSNNANISDRSGNEVYGNIFDTGSAGIRSGWTKDLIKIYNNVIMNFGKSFVTLNQATVIDIENGTDAIILHATITGIGSGATTRVKDISDLTGASPNRIGTISIDTVVGDFNNPEVLNISAVKAADTTSIIYYIGPNVKFYNNISVSPDNQHIWWDSGGADQGAIDSDYNLFHPDCSGTDDCFKDVRGAGDVDFADWKTATSQDGNSSIGDPLFVNANGDFSDVSDFKIPTDSPAKDAGVDVSLAVDYWGASIPFNLLPDIGIHEYLDWMVAHTITMTVGEIDANVLEDTYTNDDVNLVLGEQINNPGSEYEFAFGGFGNPAPTGLVTVNFRGWYEGNPSHQIKISAWDVNGEEWDDLTGEDNDFPAGASEQVLTFNTAGDGSDYITSDGIIRIRIIHLTPGNSNHSFNIDLLQLEEGVVVSIRMGLNYEGTTFQ